MRWMAWQRCQLQITYISNVRNCQKKRLVSKSTYQWNSLERHTICISTFMHTTIKSRHWWLHEFMNGNAIYTRKTRMELDQMGKQLICSTSWHQKSYRHIQPILDLNPYAVHWPLFGLNPKFGLWIECCRLNRAI